MSASTAPNAPLRYRGYNSHYVDIAVRGADEHLGFAIEYAVHPSGVGCFILRFIAHGKGVDPKNYKHLTYRESAKFVIPATETSPTAEIFKGLRLTKVAIPVFKPAIQRHEVGTFGDQFNVWAPLTEWVAAQVAAEGFSVDGGPVDGDSFAAGGPVHARRALSRACCSCRIWLLRNRRQRHSSSCRSPNPKRTSRMTKTRTKTTRSG